MKKNINIILTIILLVLINTSFFWENLPGLFDAFIMLFCFILYIILCIVLILQFRKIVLEKFKNRNRIINICFLIISIFLTYTYPFGFVNFEKMIYGNDIFFAQYEGAASGTINLKLKKDNNFIERSVFWGVEKEFGKYKIKNDTLFLEFKNKSNFNQKKSLCTKESEKLINYYMNGIDQRPLPMKIIKGNFNELKQN